YLDDVEVNKVRDFENALQSYMKSQHADLLKKVDESGDYGDDIANEFKAALVDFKANHSW
ncbi:MAG: F0F1 ATP synthase subunit alpha, partial [Gammaproteobacteria bacterium]